MSRSWTTEELQVASAAMEAAGHMGYEEFTEALELSRGGTAMKFMYNVTGAERKALVKAVSEIVGARAEYQGVPRCGYQIGSFEIDKQGTLKVPANTDVDEVAFMIAELTMSCTANPHV